MEICSPEDRIQIISCKKAGTDLPDCVRTFGPWARDGPCIATGSDPSCGPGVQSLKRACFNGTGAEICNGDDMSKTVTCVEAGSQLRDCPKVFGPWENVGTCLPTDHDKLCGHGMQTQIRQCTDGTGSELCVEDDTIQYVSCKSVGTDLPDCPKILGPWENIGPCKAIWENRTCGPGLQILRRSCINGTGQFVCNDEDKIQQISCEAAGTNLPHCPKKFEPWENVGPCIPAASNSSCGTGTQRQTRKCTDGTGPNICTAEDKERSLSCADTGTKLPDCSKIFGIWENIGECIGTEPNKYCGPGIQKQKRDCGNGTGLEICTLSDVSRELPCIEAGTSLPACRMILGRWSNIGNCVANLSNSSCGDGMQRQERTCQDSEDGKEICLDEHKVQMISCKAAGTDLPDCPKIFSEWKNSGPCLPIASITDCGPGIQVQERTCMNGTGIKVCIEDDMLQDISCKAAGTDLPDCPRLFGEWINVGDCIAEGNDGSCGWKVGWYTMLCCG